MANTAFKLFPDPQLAREALAALRAGGYPDEAVGVLVRKGNDKEVSSELNSQPAEVGTLPEIGAVAATSAEVFGLVGGGADMDISEPLATQLGLTPQAVGTFVTTLLRGGVLVAVRPSEGLPDAAQILRNAEPANVRTPKEYNEGFDKADRRTTTNQGDGQFSGDFRKY